MKKRKVLSVLLAIMMLSTAFSGCGKKDDKQTTTEPTKEATTEPTKEADTTADTSKHVTLRWYLNGNSVTKDTDVLEKANAILKEKMNVTLEPIWGSWADFNKKSVLAINGNDPVDIYFTCSWSANEYNQYARKGAWARLDDPKNNLLEKYGKDIWSILPQVLKDGAKVPGKAGKGVYALPNYKDYATQNCWDVNVPMLNKYGYTLKDIKGKTFFELGDIFKKVKEGEGKNFFPLLCEGAVLERMATNAIVLAGDGSTQSVLSYYMNPADVTQPGASGNKIVSKFGSPEYKKFAEKVYEYAQAGYINPAMSNPNQANDARTADSKIGNYLLNTQSYSLGYETETTQQRGFEVAMVPLHDPYVDTTSSQGAMMAISSGSKNKERAMMFLNYLNTNPELFTLLDYGIEGEHYDLEDGLVKFNKKVRDGYQPWTMGMGNATQLPPLVGQAPDFYDQFKAYYAEAKQIPILGFAFNQENIKSEMGAVMNVAGEYALALNTGQINPAEKLDEFNKKLEKNGIQKIVDEANKQLDDFMAQKGK